MRDTQRSRGRKKQRKRQAPQRDANVGLDPWIPGTHPEPKADAQPLSHQVSPRVWFQI